MKREIFHEIDIPEGVEVNIEKNTIFVKGSEGENKRKFYIGKLKMEKKDNKIKIGYEKSSKNEKRNMNTIISHIKNLIKGVQEKFEYKLKICFSHFPITVEIKNNEAIIKNFLGEKIARKFQLPKDAEVEMNKDILTVKSIDKEIAGQTAAILERSTRITNKDRRVFQDGIFMINKAGKEI